MVLAPSSSSRQFIRYKMTQSLLNSVPKTKCKLTILSSRTCM